MTSFAKESRESFSGHEALVLGVNGQENALRNSDSYSCLYNKSLPSLGLSVFLGRVQRIFWVVISGWALLVGTVCCIKHFGRAHWDQLKAYFALLRLYMAGNVGPSITVSW